MPRDAVTACKKWGGLPDLLKSALVVSHRWESPKMPDVRDVERWSRLGSMPAAALGSMVQPTRQTDQLKEIRDYLNANTDIKCAASPPPACSAAAVGPHVLHSRPRHLTRRLVPLSLAGTCGTTTAAFRRVSARGRRSCTSGGRSST